MGAIPLASLLHPSLSQDPQSHHHHHHHHHSSSSSKISSIFTHVYLVNTCSEI
jgi:hypothetical protein